MDIDARNSHSNPSGDKNSISDKQSTHDGVRSDTKLFSIDRRNLRSLDEMKASGMNYKGCQRDIIEAERYCKNHPSIAEDMIEKMRRRKAIDDGNRSDPYLSSIDRCNVRALHEMKTSGLNYDVDQRDVSEAERYAVYNPNIAEDLIEKMRRRKVLISELTN